MSVLAKRWLEDLASEVLSPDWRKQSKTYDYELGAGAGQVKPARSRTAKLFGSYSPPIPTSRFSTNHQRRRRQDAYGVYRHPRSRIFMRWYNML